MKISESWEEFFGGKHSYTQFILTVVFLVAIVFSLSRFIIFVESRQGVVLDDPLFHYFKAIELNIPIFTLVYGSLIACFIHLLRYPQRLLFALQTYTLLAIVRMFAMYVTPLEPPAGTIDLADPLVFVVGTGTKITKDLFFSGHTSTLFMLFLAAKSKKMKYLFFINTVLVGAFVILQKAHYTIDVLAAVFISYGCYRIVTLVYAKYFSSGKIIKSH
ncbi:hypothetical protein D4R99_03520 [bacterium]|nr:MAG: hypothetical protein D4R99_03520 [bacterium]